MYADFPGASKTEKRNLKNNRNGKSRVVPVSHMIKSPTMSAT
jgi:hypothetical protein